jgi:pSer/pThr/pTyr-binding forkhead associated (FHA) protein
VKRLVTLPSDDMSLSKTHAQFQVVPDGALVVMDRGSTNGSLLIRAGVTRRMAGGKPATMRDGDRVRFGDREMTVSRLS